MYCGQSILNNPLEYYIYKIESGNGSILPHMLNVIRLNNCSLKIWTGNFRLKMYFKLLANIFFLSQIRCVCIFECSPFSLSFVSWYVIYCMQYVLYVFIGTYQMKYLKPCIIFPKFLEFNITYLTLFHYAANNLYLGCSGYWIYFYFFEIFTSF